MFIPAATDTPTADRPVSTGASVDRLDRLEARLDAAERETRRWRRIAGGLAAAGLLGGLVAATQNADVVDVVRTQRLEVVNAEGRAQVTLFADARGGVVDVWTTGRENVARLSANDHGGDLAIWDRQAKNVAGVFALNGGGRLGAWGDQGAAILDAPAAEPRLRLRNEAGTDVVALRAGAQGALNVAGDASFARASVTGAVTVGEQLTVGDGAGSMINLTPDAATLNGPGGQSVLAADRLTLVGAGRTALRTDGLIIGDPRGGVRARLGSASNGGSLQLHNLQGTAVASLGVDGDAVGRLDLHDTTGASMLQAAAVEGAGAVLALRQPQGGPSFVVATRPEGGLINLMNAAGDVVFNTGAVGGQAGGAMTIWNGSGQEVFHAGVDGNDDGVVSVWNAARNIWRALAP